MIDLTNESFMLAATGNNPYYEELRKLDYQYAEIQLSQPQMYDALLQGQAFFDNDSDSESEGEVEEVVEVRVPPGPLGVLLDSGIESCAVVHGFTNLPTGGKGPIEMHGDVQPGMYIIGINETNASLMSLAQVTQLLGKLSRKEKVIRFAVFRPGSPKHRETIESESDTSSQASASLAPPIPIAGAKPPPTPTSGLSAFSSRFASLTSSLMDKKSSHPSTPGGSGSVPNTPKGSY